MVEPKLEKKDIPTFMTFIDGIKSFITHNDNSFFIRFKWISPLKLQISNIYYFKKDEDVSYLKELSRVNHFIYTAKELNIEGKQGRRPTLFKINVDEMELKPISSLPYEVF